MFAGAPGVTAPKPRHFDETPPWRDAQGLEVVRITPETPDVATFTFRPEGEGWFRYLPGQFVTLELPAAGVARTYTLSSSPSRPLTASVTVKAQPGSAGGRWMLDHLRVGDRLRAHGPAGDFSCRLHPAEKYLFLCAGSGITPVMSMSRWIEDEGRASDIAFIACARRPSDLIFRAELERMAAGAHPFALGLVVEATGEGEGWSGFRGRLSRSILEQVAPDFLAREVFCCGPAPFMRSARDMLAAAGFDLQHYHEESFHPVQDEAPAPAPDEPAGRVIFTVSEVEAAGEPGETLLQISRAAGVNIPSGCTMGLCGTCKVRRLSGETSMNHNGGIQDEDIEAGFVLACCTRPIGRVEIEA